MKWLDHNIEKVVFDIAMDQSWVSKGTNWDPETIEGLRSAALCYVSDTISKTRVKLKELEGQVAEAENEFKNGSHGLSQWRARRLEQSREEVSRYAAQLQSFESWDGLGDPPEYKPMQILQKKWEQPITSGKFIVGFLDMYVEASTMDISFIGNQNHSVADSSIELLEVPCWTLSHRQAFHLSFEVKTTIPNLGELLRQIRLYQQYTRPGMHYVVVSPDDADSALLKDQGILLYRCPFFSQEQRQKTLFD
ncbi:hypothetical protein [uncultured Thiodictyon sp.]|jgi:hypothetical protein|uniref:hypothetical protein n=1 Tax=uncultured Thiodictyon sp. TaxID=1846217 RepID=UPI0025D85A22|nr:hypothetical protein [uncultured Thiodictyon sp.]